MTQMGEFEPARTGENWPRHGWQGVVYDVCRRHEIKIADLMVGDKRPAVVACRREIIQRLHYAGHMQKQISGYLGLCGESVRYALRRAQGIPARTLKPAAYSYEVAS